MDFSANSDSSFKSNRRENLKNKQKKRSEISDQYQAFRKKKTELKKKINNIREEEIWQDWENQEEDI